MNIAILEYQNYLHTGLRTNAGYKKRYLKLSDTLKVDREGILVRRLSRPNDCSAGQVGGEPPTHGFSDPPCTEILSKMERIPHFYHHFMSLVLVPHYAVLADELWFSVTISKEKINFLMKK